MNGGPITRFLVKIPQKDRRFGQSGVVIRKVSTSGYDVNGVVP
jgi:hypothetical protein